MGAEIKRRGFLKRIAALVAAPAVAKAATPADAARPANAVHSAKLMKYDWREYGLSIQVSKAELYGEEDI